MYLRLKLPCEVVIVSGWIVASCRGPDYRSPAPPKVTDSVEFTECFAEPCKPGTETWVQCQVCKAPTSTYDEHTTADDMVRQQRHEDVTNFTICSTCNSPILGAYHWCSADAGILLVPSYPYTFP